MERRLAAILAADVVGYSRLMGRDEAGTLEALRVIRSEVIDAKISEHKGRVFKVTGDGVLAEFPSVVNAVACAVEIQREMAGRNTNRSEEKALRLRLGINLGDIVVESGDLFGDGVNLASRLEGIAPPGGIVVSAVVRDQIGSRLDFQFEDMGEQALKNIEHPVRAFRLRLEGSNDATIIDRPILTLPDKPSIAVLPFQNMSGDPEQEYFADGMVEEIITALSRIKWLFVIARNSSFSYKGRAVDIKQVGRDLGVRYVLEGSVRKAGNRVRITGQLIDAGTGAHLWADRFDGDLEDIFDLQDRVTESVVGAIAPKLEQAEIERATRKPTDRLDAYDYFLRGMAAFHQWNRNANNEALSLFSKAIELDPNFAAAYGLAARCYAQRKSSGWVTDRVREIAEAERLARRAGELGRDDAVALNSAGIALVFVVGDLETGATYIESALSLNPNLAWAWLASSSIRVWRGEPDEAIEHVSRAMRLSPHDPQLFVMQSAISAAHFFAGRYEEALRWAGMSIRERPDYIPSVAWAAASAAQFGNHTAATKYIERLRRLMPELRLSNLTDLFPIRRSEDFRRWSEGLRKAGLPE